MLPQIWSLKEEYLSSVTLSPKSKTLRHICMLPTGLGDFIECPGCGAVSSTLGYSGHFPESVPAD